MKKRILKAVARTLLLSLGYQLVLPTVTMALTSGPTQPEVQSFEPVGTTDMVDLFTGDFVYNVPLLDVEGYPINISYHSGINIEQEASWVGLGWNINPGVINRAVRGVPDDFNGETLTKELNIKPEKNIRVSSGGSVEIFGAFDLSAGVYVNSNNYRGLGVGFNTGAGVSAFGYASAGVNMGISSQNGADIDYSAGLGYNTSNSISRDFSMGVGVNASGGYNTRNGVKDININFSANYKSEYCGSKRGQGGSIYSTSIPISLQNFVPVITNKSQLKGFGASIGAGGEVYGVYAHGFFSLEMSKLTYDANGSRKSYGYMYLENASDKDIVDFTRDKDGMFNKTMEYLPPSATTYDVYSVSGQGTGGLFRPVRSDNGFTFDPAMESDNKTKSGGLEAGLGNLFELGGNYSSFHTEMKAGPWDEAYRGFTKKKPGSVYENVFFKQAGEMTAANAAYNSSINNTNPLALNAGNAYSLPAKRNGSEQKREPRGNVVYYLNAEEASLPQMSFSTTQLENYTDTAGLKNGPSVYKIPIPRNTGSRRNNQISEIIQVNKDGGRYVYGLPAMNLTQDEYTFSVEGGVNSSEGTVLVSGGDNSGNNKGQENYYSKTSTPSYAHSFLLTNVLSTDYVDITGNGCSDDDLGTYVKFNYSLKENNYKWRSPYKDDRAQYSPGFYSDKKDDKASYIVGTKEQWYVHSIETKNFVAEFYTSQRKDGKGAGSSPASSHKLDQIRLYNKHDRYVNQNNAVPIKTVYFEYNYSLCGGSLNSVATANVSTGDIAGGKLTLKRIYTKYGNSDKNLLSPYQFSYSSFNPDYNIASKDRWGNYKPSNSSAPNYEFPYVDQSANNDQYASAWLMDKITLPSGGVINVNYESDDYGYVQDRRAMEMVQVEGVGASSNYAPNDYTLYADKNSPFNYIYFKRKVSSEYSNDMWQNYLQGQNVVYYNFGVDIANKGSYEFVRGYADIESVGVCSGNTNYGYIKVKDKKPKGSDAKINPITYTGINMGRYYLAHLFFPGSDPDESDLENIMKGLANSLGDLMHFFSNPINRFVKDGKAKKYSKVRSFVRLHTPNLKKKGGGSRVEQIKIDDSWNAMAGGDNASGEFGNDYDYTLEDNVYGNISSGVASYEPLTGGDENPLKKPANYYANNGSKFPPNDPVELFQEEPIGESLYPSPVVGYSKVRVSSIHKNKGRSAQTEDEYEFYTAKDCPIRVLNTSISKAEKNSHKLRKSIVSMKASQAYSIIMNDMHGKPKTIKNFVNKSDVRQLITSQTYEYLLNGGQLNNNANVIDYNSNTHTFFATSATLGQDIDISVDTRSKEEHTHVAYVQANLNTFLIWVIPIPIPTFFWPQANHDREFKSLVTTKVVQQYGILKGVETVKEGAKFYAKNELYNPESGDVVLSSNNNEFKDPVYDMTFPAYWAHRGMGPTYRNICFEDTVRLMSRGPNGLPIANTNSSTWGIYSDNMDKFEIGDELLVRMEFPTYIYTPGTYITKAWVTAYNNMPYVSRRSGPFLPAQVISWLGNNAALAENFKAYVKIIRSGYRNMLSFPMQQTNSIDYPQLSTSNVFKNNKTINSSVASYSDSLIKLLPWHDVPDQSDTNRIIFGYTGNHRLAEKRTFFTGRDYSSGHARKNGTYVVNTGFWQMNPLYWNHYSINKTNPVVPNPAAVVNGIVAPWKKTQSVSAYNVWGNEIEDKDALDIPSTAVFGFNNSQPVAVAANASAHEVIAESFEDYRVLHLEPWRFSYSPFKSLFNWATMPPALSPYRFYDMNGISGTNVSLINTESHTGSYALSVFNSGAQVLISTSPLPAAKLNKFTFKKNKKYVVSCWAKPASGSSSPNITLTLLDGSNATISTAPLTSKSNVIDGWQLFEGVVSIGNNIENVRLNLPSYFYYDDLRSYPADANMKAFVYNPINYKLISTLDENNFATFYEYDNEGQLIRVNKETERGILTVQESRNANVKNN
jgi:hypothetical protein